MKHLVNVSEQLGNVGEQLEILSALVLSQPSAALKRLTALTEPLLPKYKRKFKDALLDEQEREWLEQDLAEERVFDGNLEEHVRLILEDIDVEFNNNRTWMKNILVFYNRVPKYRFGDRILQLCDLIAGCFQSGLSKEHVHLVLEFVSYELQKASRIIGNDY